MRITIDTALDSEAHAKHAIAVLCSLYGIPPHTPVVLPAPPLGEDRPAAARVPAPTPAPVAALQPASAVVALPAGEQHPDTRDPAAVFGAAGNGQVAPLAAGATALPNVPGVLQGSLPLPPAGTTANAPALAGAGNAQAANAAPAGTPGNAHASGVTLDKDGIPWDPRIHANAAEKMGKDGYWKKRRGMNDEAKTKAIIAELQQSMAAGGGAAPVTPVTLLPAGPLVGTITALPVPPGGVMTFEALMPLIGQATTKGIATVADLTAIVQMQGLPNLPSISTRRDLIPKIWEDMQAAFPGLSTLL